MKAITLWQPWATLVAMGYKHIETRSWQPGYCGPIAIHAAKKLPESGWGREKLDDKVFREVVFDRGPIPTGVILAITSITHVEPITASNAPGWPERQFGDYTPGRYMWRLDTPTLLVEPIPALGRQKLWEWTPICQEKGCKYEAMQCALYDDRQNRDIGWFYCPEHAAQHGFCSFCGNFYASTSEYERWNGSGVWYCSNCDEAYNEDRECDDGDECDEGLELWSEYPGDLLIGNLDYGKLRPEREPDNAT